MTDETTARNSEFHMDMPYLDENGLSPLQVGFTPFTGPEQPPAQTRQAAIEGVDDTSDTFVATATDINGERHEVVLRTENPGDTTALANEAAEHFVKVSKRILSLDFELGTTSQDINIVDKGDGKFEITMTFETEHGYREGPEKTFVYEVELEQVNTVSFVSTGNIFSGGGNVFGGDIPFEVEVLGFEGPFFDSGTNSFTITNGVSEELLVSDDDAAFDIELPFMTQMPQDTGAPQVLAHDVTIDGRTYEAGESVYTTGPIQLVDEATGREYTAVGIGIGEQEAIFDFRGDSNIVGYAFVGELPPPGVELTFPSGPIELDTTPINYDALAGAYPSPIEFTFGGTSYSASGADFSDAELETLARVNWDEALTTNVFFDPNGDNGILDNLGLYHWSGGDAELTNKVLDLTFSDGTDTFTLRDVVEGTVPSPFQGDADAGRFVQNLLATIDPSRFTATDATDVAAPEPAPTDGRNLQVVNGEIDGDTAGARAEDASLERSGEAWAQVVDQLGEVPDWTDAEWFTVLLGFYSGESGSDLTRLDWKEFFEVNVNEAGELATGPLSGQVVETFGSDVVRTAWQDAPLLSYSAKAHKLPAVENAGTPVPATAFIVPPSDEARNTARSGSATSIQEELLRTGMTTFSADDDNREFFLTGLSGEDITNGLLSEDGLANHALVGAIMWVGRDAIDTGMSAEKGWWEGPSVAQLDDASIVAEDTVADPNAFAVYEITITEGGEERTVMANKTDLARLEADPSIVVSNKSQVTDAGSARLYWAQEALNAYEANGGQPPADVLLAQAFYTLHTHYSPAAEVQTYENDDYSDPDFVHRNTTRGTSNEMLFETDTIDTRPQRTDGYALDYLARTLDLSGDPTVDSITGKVTGATSIVDVASGWATGNVYHDEFSQSESRGPQLHTKADNYATALSTRGRAGSFVEDALDTRGNELTSKQNWTLATIAIGSLFELVGGAGGLGSLLTTTGRVEKIVVGGRTFFVSERVAGEALRVAQEADSTVTALSSTAIQTLNAADRAKVLGILSRGSVASPFIGTLLSENAALTGATASTGFAVFQIASDGTDPVQIRGGASATETEQEDTTLTAKARIDAINNALLVVDAYRDAEANAGDPVLAALALMQDLPASQYHAVLEYLPDDMSTSLSTWHADEVSVLLSEAPFDLTGTTPLDAASTAGYLEGLFGTDGPSAAEAGLIHSVLQQIEATHGTDAARDVLMAMDPEVAAFVVAYSQAESSEAAANSGDEGETLAFAVGLLVEVANTDTEASAAIMEALASSDLVVAAQALYDVGRLSGIGDSAKMLIGVDPNLAGQVLALTDELSLLGNAAGHNNGTGMANTIAAQILAQTDDLDIDNARLTVVSYLARNPNLSAAQRETFVSTFDADDQTAIGSFLDSPGLTFATASEPGTDSTSAKELAAALLLTNATYDLPAAVASITDPTILANLLSVMSDEDAALILGAVAQDRPEFARQAVDFGLYNFDDGFEEVGEWFQLLDPKAGGAILNDLLGDDRHQDIAALLDAIGDGRQVAHLLNTVPIDAAEGIMALMLNDGLVTEVMFGGIFKMRTPHADNADALTPEVQAKLDSLATRVASGELTDEQARSELLDFMLNVQGVDPEDGDVRIRSQDGTTSWSLDELYQIYSDTKAEFISLISDPTQLFDSFIEELDAFVQANFPTLVGMRDELMTLANVLFNGADDMSPDDARRRLSEIFEIEEGDVDGFIGDVRELMNTTNTTDTPSGSPSEIPSGSPSDTPSGSPTDSNAPSESTSPSGSPTEEPYVPPTRIFEAFASVGLNYQFRAKFAGETAFAGFEKFSVQPIFLLGVGSAGTSGMGTVGHDIADNELNYQVRLRFTLNGKTTEALDAYLLGNNQSTNFVPSIDNEFAFDLRFKLKSVFGEGTRVSAVQIAAYNEPSVSSFIFPQAPNPAAPAATERPGLLNILLAQIRFGTEGLVRGGVGAAQGAAGAASDPQQLFADFSTWVTTLSPALRTAFDTFKTSLGAGLGATGTAGRDALSALWDGLGNGVQGLVTFLSNAANTPGQDFTDLLQSLVAYTDEAIVSLRAAGADFNDPRVQYMDQIRQSLIAVVNTPVGGPDWRAQAIGHLQKAGMTAGLALLTVGAELPAFVAYNTIKYVGIGTLWAGYSLGKLGLNAGILAAKSFGTAVHEVFKATQGKWTFGVDWTVKLTWLNDQVVHKDDQGNDLPFDGNGLEEVDRTPDILTFSAFGFGQAAANTAVPIPGFESIRNILNGGFEIGVDFAFTEDGRIKNADDRGITDEI